MGVMTRVHHEVDMSMLDGRVWKVAGWLDVLGQQFVGACLSVTQRVAELPDVIAQVVAPMSHSSARASSHSHELSQADMEQTILSYTLAALAAKLMQVDGGQIHPKEKAAFMAIFSMQGVGASRMKALFLAACRDAAPVEQYAKQVSVLFAGKPQQRMSVLQRFIALAAADAPLNTKEYDVLLVIAQALSIPSEQLANAIDLQDGPRTGTPWDILRIDKTASLEQVQQAYRERVKACHPDRWSTHQKYALMRKQATEKSVIINAAYAEITRKKR